MWQYRGDQCGGWEAAVDNAVTFTFAARNHRIPGIGNVKSSRRTSDHGAQDYRQLCIIVIIIACGQMCSGESNWPISCLISGPSCPISGHISGPSCPISNWPISGPNCPISCIISEAISDIISEDITSEVISEGTKLLEAASWSCQGQCARASGWATIAQSCPNKLIGTQGCSGSKGICASSHAAESQDKAAATCTSTTKAPAGARGGGV